MKTNLAFIWFQIEMCIQMVPNAMLTAEVFWTDVTLESLNNVSYIHLLDVHIVHVILMIFAMVYREMISQITASFKCFWANLNYPISWLWFLMAEKKLTPTPQQNGFKLEWVIMWLLKWFLLLQTFEQVPHVWSFDFIMGLYCRLNAFTGIEVKSRFESPWPWKWVARCCTIVSFLWNFFEQI